jgi:hypothetical protein
MAMYQLWAHQMFPATNFNDTVKRVETICKKRTMTVRRVSARISRP